jgi:hypothetical protein
MEGHLVCCCIVCVIVVTAVHCHYSPFLLVRTVELASSAILLMQLSQTSALVVPLPSVGLHIHAQWARQYNEDGAVRSSSMLWFAPRRTHFLPNRFDQLQCGDDSLQRQLRDGDGRLEGVAVFCARCMASSKTVQIAKGSAIWPSSALVRAA